MSHKYITLRLMTVGLALLTMASVSSAQKYWERQLGGGMESASSVMAPTTNGNFITMAAGITQIFIYCVKPNGDTLWAKFPPGPAGDSTIDQISAITPLRDGTFMAVANSSILKVSQSGDILWVKMPSGIGVSRTLQCITATQDSNFLVAGTGHDSTWEKCFIKINPDGVPLWTKTYKTSGTWYVRRILQTQDGGFLSVGGDIMKIDPNGDTIWTKTYGGKNYDDIIQSQEGNFIVVGDNVIKIDSDGGIIWTDSFFTGPIVSVLNKVT